MINLSLMNLWIDQSYSFFHLSDFNQNVDISVINEI